MNVTWPPYFHIPVIKHVIVTRLHSHIIMAYQKSMVIRDYLAITLRSLITNCIQKTMVIDCIETCIIYDHGRSATIVAGSQRSQQDRDDRSRIAWGILNIGIT